jgi:hypothetical protein
MKGEPPLALAAQLDYVVRAAAVIHRGGSVYSSCYAGSACSIRRGAAGRERTDE